MRFEKLPYNFTVCKLESLASFTSQGVFFLSATDNELSLVCESRFVPQSTVEKNDGWKAFRVAGTLDFSLVGILAAITKALAEKNIGVFAVSTYDTDYILVKAENFEAAAKVLQASEVKENGR